MSIRHFIRTTRLLLDEKRIFSNAAENYRKLVLVTVHGCRLTVHENERHEERMSATFEELEVRIVTVNGYLL